MRFLKLKIVPLLFLILLSVSSCEKELDFKYHDIDPIPVIEAELTPGGIQVSITMTTPMDEPLDRTHLTDATVTLEDLSEGIIFYPVADGDGIYRDATPGVPGHEYRLTVEREGCRYVAKTVMYPPTEIVGLSFSWIRMPYDHVAVLRCDFLDNPSTSLDCYWVKIFRNGKIYRWMEVDDRSAKEGVKSVAMMTTRMDTDEEDEEDLLLAGDEVTVTVSQITPDMHEYLETLQNDSNGTAMFTGDFCLGYFTATSPVSSTIIFDPAEIH